MNLSKIIETSLYADNLELSEKFYTNVLGLKLIKKKDGRHLFFKCGDQMLLLFNPENTKEETGLSPKHGAKGSGHIAFSLDGSKFKEWKEHLKNSGVVTEKEVEWPNGGMSLYFRDPSGNSLELTTPSVWGL